MRCEKKKEGEDQKNGSRSASRASRQIQDDGLKVQGLRDGCEQERGAKQRTDINLALSVPRMEGTHKTKGKSLPGQTSQASQGGKSLSMGKAREEGND